MLRHARVPSLPLYGRVLVRRARAWDDPRALGARGVGGGIRPPMVRDSIFGFRIFCVRVRRRCGRGSGSGMFYVWYYIVLCEGSNNTVGLVLPIYSLT
jgi:hypothetical protein